MLTGLSGYINGFAFLIAAAGLPLFAGTKRETVFDKDNLVGLMLVGFALLLHGGFGILLRSSPNVAFNGYVLGWDGGHNEGRFWIYDLGSPNELPQGAPSRGLHLEWTKSNPVLLYVWQIDGSYRLNVRYRLWDYEITSIDAQPSPELRARALTSWHWESHAEALSCLTVQTIIGVGFVVTATVLSLRPRHL